MDPDHDDTLLASPSPNLLNCLSTPLDDLNPSKIPSISSLCADGIRQIVVSSSSSSPSPSSSSSVPSPSTSSLSPSATSTIQTLKSSSITPTSPLNITPTLQSVLHCYLISYIYITVHDDHVYIHLIPNEDFQAIIKTITIHPRLHFKPKSIHVTSCAHNKTIVKLIVGGYDGAYYSIVDLNSFQHSPLKPFSGTSGFHVSSVYATSNLAMAALVDSRIAVWQWSHHHVFNETTQPMYIINPGITSLNGDKITDLHFHHATCQLIVTYWSGLICIYNLNRNDNQFNSIKSPTFQLYTNIDRRGDTLFYLRGSTLIVSRRNLNNQDNNHTIAIIDGDGFIVFINLIDFTCVKRSILSNIQAKKNNDSHTQIKVKGACIDSNNDRVLVWVIGSKSLVSIDWPSPMEFHIVKKVEKEVARRRKAEAEGNASKQHTLDKNSDVEHRDIGEQVV